jgi:signal transduction histidine kinase
MNSALDTDTPQRRHTRWPFYWALLTASIGLFVTWQTTSRMIAEEERAALERFRLEAETVRRNTEQELQLFVSVLDSIRALHGISGEISADALAEFVDKGMLYQRQVLGSFGFAQQINQALRENLEEAHLDDHAVGYRVVEAGAAGEWAAARTRSIYFPLTWESKVNGLHVPIGFDFLSRPDAREAIERMVKTQRPALVGESVHAQGSGRQHWVFSPIFHAPANTANLTSPQPLIGFAVGLIRPEELLGRVAVASLPSASLQLTLQPGRHQNLDQEEIQRANDYWIYRHPIEVIDLPWTFECRLPVQISQQAAMTAAVAGFLITLLVTSQLILLIGRTRRVEEEVRVRTRDLEAAKHQLEVQMQERMRLEEGMNDLATRERQRLGRDLHDSLGQKLTGAVFLSRSLHSHLQGSGSEQETHAHTLNQTLKSAVGQVRAMARGLAPVTLNDESLGDALTQLADEMTDLYGVSCQYQGDHDGAILDQKTKEQLYLIAREAVNNAARHSHPDKVTLSLHVNGGQFTLQVVDDGTGMPPTAGQNGDSGMGLRIMRHRAQMIGATLDICPHTPSGTVVECHRPAPPPASHD